MITIIDGNNYFRRLIEVGSDARSVLNNLFNPRNTTYVVWDGEKGSQRRRSLYPQYKTNRGPLDKDIAIHFSTLVRVLQSCNIVQLFHNDYEGDDVIATLARSLAGAGDRVHIESRDADFLQIVAEFPDLVTCAAEGKTTPELTQLYKIWVGDAADKISGIPGFGDKAWENIDHEKLWLCTTIARDQGRLIDIGLPKTVKPTVELIRTLSTIIGFFPVPASELDIIVGRPDYAVADAFLKEFLQ